MNINKKFSTETIQKMESDRKLAEDDSIKCQLCGTECKSTYYGKKMCIACMSKMSNSCEFAEWYLQNEKRYYGSIESIYYAWINAGKPSLIAQKEQSIIANVSEPYLAKCDVCGCHPSVIIRTRFGTFCEAHARCVS